MRFDELVALGLGRLTDEEVAALANVTRQRIQQIRKAHGVPVDEERAKSRAKAAALQQILNRLGPRDQKVLACWKRLQNVNQCAVQLRLPYMSIKNALLRSGVSPEPIRRAIDWSGVDWTKSTSELARELDTTPSYISRMRTSAEAHGKATRRGVETLPMKRAAARAERIFQVVDWKRPNYLVAERLGTHPRHVVTLRRELRRRGFDVPAAPRLGPRKKTKPAGTN